MKPVRVPLPSPREGSVTNPRGRRGLALASLLGALGAGCASSAIPAPADIAPWLPPERPAEADAAGDPDDPLAGIAITIAPSAEDGTGDWPIRLEVILELSAGTALEVGIARQDLERARAEQRMAAALWFPTLALGTALYHHEGRTQSTEGLLLDDVHKRNAQTALGLELTLDPAGAHFAGYAARARSRAARLALDAAAHASLHAGANGWFDLLEAQAQLAIARGARRRAEELVELERTRHELGQGLLVDLLRARAHLQRARGEVIAAANERRLASTTLAELLGLEPGAAYTPEQGELRPLRLVVETDLDLLIERALAARPDLGAARAGQRAHEAEARAARLDWLVPRLSVQASVGSMGDDLDDLERQEAFTAALRWDLGLHLFGAAARAEALSRTASLETERSRRRAVSDVVRAWSAGRSSQALILAAVEEVSVAEAALDLSLLRVEQGAGLLLEALEADLDLSRARRSLVRAVGDFNRAQYALLRAVGGAD